MVALAFERLTAATVCHDDDVALNYLLKVLSPRNTPRRLDGWRTVARKNYLLVARNKSSRIVGMALLVFKETGSGRLADIEDVSVHTLYQRKGIGATLVEKLIEHARGRRAKHIDWTSSPQRIAANKMYRKLGFKKRKTNNYRVVFDV